MARKSPARRNTVRATRREVLFSQACLEIAKELSYLPTYAAIDDGIAASHVEHSVRSIQRLLRAGAGRLLCQVGDQYVTGGPADLVWVGGKAYESAHHAAIKEASRILTELWLVVDLKGRRSFFERAKAAKSGDPEVIEALTYGTGINLPSIAKNWPLAKALIEGLLTPAWQSDFAAVTPRIVREQATASIVQLPSNFHAGSTEHRGSKSSGTPRKRGPKIKYKPEDDQKLLRDWQAAKSNGSTIQEFCRVRSLAPKVIVNAQSRQRNRLSKSKPR